MPVPAPDHNPALCPHTPCDNSIKGHQSASGEEGRGVLVNYRRLTSPNLTLHLTTGWLVRAVLREVSLVIGVTALTITNTPADQYRRKSRLYQRLLCWQVISNKRSKPLQRRLRIPHAARSQYIGGHEPRLAGEVALTGLGNPLAACGTSRVVGAMWEPRVSKGRCYPCHGESIVSRHFAVTLWESAGSA